MEEVEWFPTIVNEIMKCEAKLREMATELQLEDAQGEVPSPYKLELDLEEVATDLDVVVDMLMHSAFLRLPYGTGIREKVYSASNILKECRDIARDLITFIDEVIIKEKLVERLGRNWWKPKYYPPDILVRYMPSRPTGWVKWRERINIPNEMATLCRIAYEGLGRKACMWDWYSEPLASFAIVLNDLATVIHRVAEMLSSLGFAHRIADFAYTMNSHPAIRAAAIAFSDTVKRMYSLKLIAKEDSGVQIAIARGYELTLRLGSAPGHGAHLDIAKREFIYYDEDDEVNEILRDLMWGITDARVVYHEGVRGYVDENNVVNVARVLACAISMDIRLGDPEMWFRALETIKEHEPDTYNKLAVELAKRYGIKRCDPIELYVLSVNEAKLHEFLEGEIAEEISSELEALAGTTYVGEAVDKLRHILYTIYNVYGGFFIVGEDWKKVAEALEECERKIKKCYEELINNEISIEDALDATQDALNECYDKIYNINKEILTKWYKLGLETMIYPENLERILCRVVILRM